MLDVVAHSVEKAVTSFGHLGGGLLPMLHAIQDDLGYVPTAAVEPLARALNLSRAEVHGVISFYHDFRTEPAGRHVLQLCRAEACQSVGAEQVADAARSALSIDFDQTTVDGSVSLRPVFCLGNCACAPAAMLDGQLLGRLTAKRVQDLIASLVQK
jgi:formate dehydrogenase subunit gamma